mmetsp:Transcript_9091/g.24704  ORF Transcript_9091/g.24704 Transcript_9091/m.24704 type:complete len:97 (+) Transcript_9091:20-310(+)
MIVFKIQYFAMILVHRISQGFKLQAHNSQDHQWKTRNYLPILISASHNHTMVPTEIIPAFVGGGPSFVLPPSSFPLSVLAHREVHPFTQLDSADHY